MIKNSTIYEKIIKNILQFKKRNLNGLTAYRESKGFKQRSLPQKNSEEFNRGSPPSPETQAPSRG